MLHLLGRGQEPEWDEDKHDIEEVFAFLCYRGIHYAKTVYIDFTMEGPSSVSYTHLTLPTKA